MLTELTLENYRGFDQHSLPLRPRTIIVGRNNAGKSTIVEALRLVALVTARLPNSPFKPAPEWLNIPGAARGILPAVDRLSFDFHTAQHRYSNPPSIVAARFDTGASLRIFVGPEEVFAAAYDSKGRVIRDRAGARALALPPVAILPQIGPLSFDEGTLTPEYVRRMQDTPLASQHFRNQLLLDPAAYRRFRPLVEATWPGVRIEDLTVGDADQNNTYNSSGLGRIRLMVRNDDFVGEAARMGSGLQMWLQTMWFLARTPTDATTILDEPDVYMHPDLERRLVRVLDGRHTQAIIATHSAEIMAEVQPDEVLVVDRNRPSSSFATSLPVVQRVLDALGSVHNLHLARLWTARRLLLVEGDDVAILGPIHATLFPNSDGLLETLPQADVGGWGGWERVMGSADVMRNAVGEAIAVYVLFDRDYRSPTQLLERREKARQARVNLHIWERKEIENYLLVPSAIARLIAARVRPPQRPPTGDEVARALDEIEGRLWPDITEPALVTAFSLDVKGNPGTALRRAREYAAPLRATREGRWALASGKEMLSLLSKWSQATFGVSFGPHAVARALRADEVPKELGRVLAAIEAGQSFPPGHGEREAPPA